MKTDVLLAVYQGEKYLPFLMNSLYRQTRQDFRILWQDDGSTDGTASYLSGLSSYNSRIVPGSQQNRHLGAAGNFLSLLRQSDADEIFLCDQDDMWEPEKIAVLSDALKKAQQSFGSETPLLIHSDCSLIDENGNLTGASFFRLQGWDPEAVTLPRLLVQNNATGCTMLLNRPLADLVRTYGRAENMFMHDWFIALSAASYGRIIFVDKPLVRYRQHNKNAIGASRASLFQRAGTALKNREEARSRIALTYSHSRSFMEAYGLFLPPAAKQLITDYLATETLPKFARILQIRKLGCVMQSPVTRIGQIFFG